METTIVCCSYIRDVGAFVTQGVQFEVSYGTPYSYCPFSNTVTHSIPGNRYTMSHELAGGKALKRFRDSSWGRLNPKSLNPKTLNTKTLTPKTLNPKTLNRKP